MSPARDRLNSDLTLLAFSDQTFSGIDADLTQIAAHSFRQDFSNLKRRPARRILFQTMVGFNHFNVVVVSPAFLPSR